MIPYWSHTGNQTLLHWISVEQHSPEIHQKLSYPERQSWRIASIRVVFISERNRNQTECVLQFCIQLIWSTVLHHTTNNHFILKQLTIISYFNWLLLCSICYALFVSEIAQIRMSYAIRITDRPTISTVFIIW